MTAEMLGYGLIGFAIGFVVALVVVGFARFPPNNLIDLNRHLSRPTRPSDGHGDNR